MIDGIRLADDELRMLFNFRSSKAAFLKRPEETASIYTCGSGSASTPASSDFIAPAEAATYQTSVALDIDSAKKLKAEREAEYDVAQEILKEKRNMKCATADDYDALAVLAEQLGNSSTAKRIRGMAKGLRDRGRVSDLRDVDD